MFVINEFHVNIEILDQKVPKLALFSATMATAKGFKQLFYQLHTSIPIVIHYEDLKSNYENPIGKRTKQCLVLCRAQI